MNIKRWRNLSSLAGDALKKIPNSQIAKVNLVLTMRCNHKCLSCSIWKSNENKKEELSCSDVSRILEKNPQMMWVSITGGEPSLALDFPEILSKCLQRVKLVNIITNGERPDIIIPSVKKALESSPENHILILHVTLFGKPLIHDKMTGIPHSYDKAIETMNGLKRLGYEHRLILGIEHMIGENNPFEYQFVQHKANQLNVGITYTLEQHADYYNNNVVKPDYKMPNISMTMNPLDQIKNTFLLNGVHKAGCVAGEYSCWVTPNKMVYPCFFSIPNKPAYNLPENDYVLDKDMFDKTWIKSCKGCWTPCESYTMLMFRPWRITRKMRV